MIHRVCSFMCARSGAGLSGVLLGALVLAGAVLMVGVGVGSMVGCGGESRRPARPQSVSVVSRDVPPILRGTIGSEARLEGLDPTIVTGYGLVVGLNGTGSSDVPLGVRAVLEREMLMLGVGQEPGPLAGVTPSMMIDDPNTAVVLVQAVIPPAAPRGSRFDVRVATLPGSAVTSLAGGRLYTTELRQGEVSPSAPMTPAIARARGDLFINPLTDVGGGTAGAVRARILNGGEVVTPFRPTLTMDVPSHGRVRATVDAINSRLGSRPNAVAIGRNEEIIEIAIPDRYRERTDEFVNILRHLRIDQRFPAQFAQRYVDALVSQPELADNLSWCIVAIGPAAIPVVRELYDHPESVPRLAALQAGARLDDPLVRPELKALITDGSEAVRTRAIRLLGELNPDDLSINAFLYDLLDSSDEPDVIVAAYEALAKRRDIRVTRRRLPGPFFLDIVQASRPVVYASQSEEPVIAVIGPNHEVVAPSLVNAFDGRLLMQRETGGDRVDMFFRPVSGSTIRATTLPGVFEIARTLAHKPTPERPEPGFDLNYSAVVGAMYEMVSSGALPGDFFTQAQIRELEFLRQISRDTLTARPELSEEDPENDPFGVIAPEDRPEP